MRIRGSGRRLVALVCMVLSLAASAAAQSSAIGAIMGTVTVLLGAPAPAGAQGSPAGTLAGTISDPSGAVLPGVAVTAKSLQTGLTQQTVSTGEGDWRMPGLPIRTRLRSNWTASKSWSAAASPSKPRQRVPSL